MIMNVAVLIKFYLQQDGGEQLESIRWKCMKFAKTSSEYFVLHDVIETNIFTSDDTIYLFFSFWFHLYIPIV